MSTAKICVDDALKALNAVLKSEQDIFYKERVKGIINGLCVVKDRIKTYEKVRNYPDTVIVIEGETLRRATKEEVFKMIRDEKDLDRL